MSIRRAKRNRGYTVISNAVYANNCLSWRAMGLLSFVLSKPDDWCIWPKALVKVTEGTAKNDKVGVVYDILKELKAVGFVQMAKLADGTVEYVVHDEPVLENHDQVNNQGVMGQKKPVPENPDQAFPDQENPDQDFQEVILNTERQPNPDLKINPDLPTRGGGAKHPEAVEPGNSEGKEGFFAAQSGKAKAVEANTAPKDLDGWATAEDQNTLVAAKKEPEPAEGVRWPEGLSEAELADLQLLLPKCGGQRLVDAWVWKTTHEQVNNRVGLFGYLCKQARAGMLEAVLSESCKAALKAGAEGAGLVSQPAADNREKHERLRFLDAELKGITQMASLSRAGVPSGLGGVVRRLKEEWLGLTGQEWAV